MIKIFSLNKKGFLGAIGDDLPSLIPLIFAVLVFLAVFTNTWNTYGQKTDKMEIFLYALKISDVISSQDYIDNYESFVNNCNKAKTETKYKFVAGLTPLTVSPLKENAQHLKTITYSDLKNYQETLEDYGDLDSLQEDEKKFFYIEDEYGNGMHYYCSNTEKTPSTNMTVQLFPVALERDYIDAQGEPRFYIQPMLLMVAIWN